MTARRVILVTGGNSGIGYETVKAFLKADKPYHILLGSRSLDNARNAVGSAQQECPGASNTVEALQVDLSSDESIGAAFEQVKSSPGHIDVLLNNAGATFDLKYLAGQVSLRESFTRSYDVNVAGTTVMTSVFMPLLLKSTDPRLIFVSGLSAINQAGEKYFPTPTLPAGWPKHLDFETIGYRCSKTALNMLMLDWSHKLKEDGVKVWAVLPGFVATNLGGIPSRAKAMGAGHPSTSGSLLKTIVEGERDAEAGKLIGKNGVHPW